MKFADRLKFTATGTSAATITFSAAVAGFRTLAQVIADGASDPLAIKVGETGVPFTIDDGAGNKETSLFTVTSATVLTRTSVLSSSAGGATAATFTGASLSVFSGMPASFASKLPTAISDPAGNTLGFLTPEGKATSFRKPSRLISANVPSSGAGSYIPASYPKTRAALAAVRAGTANMLFGLIGDSTTMGVGALNVSTANNRSVAPIESLARAFNSVDIPARSNSFDGDSNFYVTTLGASNGGAGSGYQGYDNRVQLPTGWVETTAQTAGGAFFQNTTNVAALIFYYAGWDATDTAVVRYKTGPNATPFNISRAVQGSYPAWTTQTITPVLTEGVGVAVVTGALSQSGIFITPTVAGTVEILGIEVYDSTTKCVRMHSLAWSGGDTAQMVATGNGAAWNPLPALLGMKLDLVSIQLGTNGWGNSIAVATWQANLDTLVAANLNNGTEVILLTPYPSAFATAPYATQMSYVNAIYAVALKYGLIVNDVFRKTGVQESGYQYGLYFDNKHPRNPLYQNTMEGLADVILSII